MACVVAPEIQISPLPGIEAPLHQLGHHPGFKQRTPCRMGGQAGGIADAQQPGHQAHIQKIQLGCFGQTLAKIGVVRRQLKAQVTGFQHRQPLPGCDRRDAAVGPQCRQVQQLPRAGRTHAHKTLKLAQVAHGQQLAHIALQIGAHIVGKPVAGQHIPVIQAGVAAFEQHGIQVGAQPSACQLGPRQRQQLYPTHPPSQRLGDARHQVKLCRACQYKVAHALALIHQGLQP